MIKQVKRLVNPTLQVITSRKDKDMPKTKQAKRKVLLDRIEELEYMLDQADIALAGNVLLEKQRQFKLSKILCFFGLHKQLNDDDRCCRCYKKHAYGGWNV